METTTTAASEKMDSVFVVKMPTAMREQVIQRAANEGRSASAVIREAIAQYAGADDRGDGCHVPPTATRGS